MCLDQILSDGSKKIRQGEASPIYIIRGPFEVFFSKIEANVTWEFKTLCNFKFCKLLYTIGKCL